MYLTKLEHDYHTESEVTTIIYPRDEVTSIDLWKLVEEEKRSHQWPTIHRNISAINQLPSNLSSSSMELRYELVRPIFSEKRYHYHS